VFIIPTEGNAIDKIGVPAKNGLGFPCYNGAGYLILKRIRIEKADEESEKNCDSDSDRMLHVSEPIIRISLH
jgi:hypothetical protein